MSTPNPLAQIRSLGDTKDCISILSTLSVLGSREGPFTADKLRQLIVGEAHFRALLARDQVGYFTAVADDSGRTQTDAFAKHMQLVHSHFASAFQRYATRKEAWLETAEDEVLARRATALAIANFAALVKWSYFLHEALKGTSWSELHALYYFAETEGFQHQPLEIYGANSEYNPSILALYLRALVLDIINPGSLSAAQIEIAEAWLSAWCLDYTLEITYSPRSHLIYVDLAEHAGFHLITPGVQGDTIRYLRADAMGAQIEEAKEELRQGRKYAGRDSTHDFPVELHAGLLSSIERVYQSILARSGNRIEERTQAGDLTMEIALGFDSVLKATAEGKTSTTVLDLDIAEPEANAGAPEIWKVHDYSTSGFGLLVDRATGEVVPLQTIIAIRVPGAKHWALGYIVRKLTNRVQGQTLIGIEMLSFRPMSVSLKRVADAGATDNVSVGALYVADREGDGKRDCLVIRQADFANRNAFEITAHGMHYRVRLNRAVKKGTDWIALRFDVDNKRG